MRETETIVEVKQVEKLVRIVCDMCGEDCNQYDAGPDYMKLEAQWGYGPPVDGESWSAEVCWKCVSRVLMGMIRFRRTDNYNGDCTGRPIVIGYEKGPDGKSDFNRPVHLDVKDKAREAS